MKILFFPFADFKMGGPRIRVENIHKELVKRRYNSKVFPPKNKIHYFTRYCNILKGDILHFQKTFDPISVMVMYLSKLLKKKIILDLDMNFYDVDFSNVDIPKIDKIKIKIAKFFSIYASRVADILIVNNHELKKRAEKYSKNVYLLEAGVDLKDYRLKKKYGLDKNIVIGWLGNGATHRKNLELLINPLNILGRKYKNIIFRIVGALYNKELYKSFKKVKNVKLDFIDEIKWDAKTIVNNTIKFDIGVAPMRIVKESEAKDLYKVREYMALGLPFVTSEVGENRYLIKDGYNGLLARNDKEWVEKLEKLIKSKKLREKIGKGGRNTIKNNYSIEKNTNKFIKIVFS